MKETFIYKALKDRGYSDKKIKDNWELIVDVHGIIIQAQEQPSKLT